MNVANVMTPRSAVVTAELPGTRDDVLSYLQEREFSSVPVVKEVDGTEEYRGLVSREALIEQPDEDQLAMLLEEVPTVTADTDLRELARTMVTEHARRVPVVDGELEGMVTVTDVIEAIANEELAVEGAVGPLATPDVNACYEATPLTVAERELHYANVPYAVCLDDEGEMAGMLTEVDIIDVARVVEGEEETGHSIAGEDDEWKWESIKAVGGRYMPTRNVEIPSEPVAEFMTRDLITVRRSEGVVETAQRMITNDVEQIPMTSGDDLVGIVRDLDLLEALYE